MIEVADDRHQRPQEFPRQALVLAENQVSRRFGSWASKQMTLSSGPSLSMPAAHPEFRSGSQRFLERCFREEKDGRRVFRKVAAPFFFGISSSVQSPNKTLQPTTTAGTSAAEPPRVPAAVVAHL